MFALDLTRLGRIGLVLTASALFATTASAQTAVKFSLDWKFEGPAAPFTVAIDKGYFKAEGLDVTIDTAGGSLEPLNRVASGTYDMGFGDINSLIKFRDANPACRSRPSTCSTTSRRSRSSAARAAASPRRRISKARSSARRRPTAPTRSGRSSRRPTASIPSKVTIENVGFPVREPMLAAGQVDAITGFSFSSYINLKDRGVPADDITVLLMADYGVNLYGNTDHREPEVRRREAGGREGLPARPHQGHEGDREEPATAWSTRVIKRNDVAKKDVELERLQMAIKDNIMTAGSEEERLRRRRHGPPRQVDRTDRAHLRVQERQAEGGRRSSTPRSCLPAAARKAE